MRKTVLTTAIFAVTLAMPAMADHHKSGKQEDGQQRGGKMFERLDANNDGKIDRSEMEQARNDRFSRFDTDGDGRVTQAEFEAGHESMREERREARQARMFERHDADGDGVLTADELPGQGMERMLDRLDSDGDGAVSRDEFGKHHGKMHGKGKGKDKGGMMRHNRDDGKEDDDGRY